MKRITGKFLKSLLLTAAVLILCCGHAQAAKGQWIMKNGLWRYRQADGTYARKTFLKIGKKYYYFKGNKYVKQGWIKVGGYTYYGTKSTVAGKAGKLKHGWAKTKGRKYYYFQPTGGPGKYGRMMTGWQTIGGKIYYFGPKGVMLTGWHTIDGNTYYFDPEGVVGTRGALHTGWLTIGEDRYYFETTGDYGTIGAQYKNQWGPKGYSTRVHFDENGNIDKETMTKTEFVEYIGELAHQDMMKTGVLASVTAAQAILESGYGMSLLALEANNLFGIKAPKTATWKGTTWDGVSRYGVKTMETIGGKKVEVYAYFSAYQSWAESLEDHSAYLANKTIGSSSTLRYPGIVGCTAYKKAFQIIKSGGYATDPDYVSMLCRVVEKWDLTKYDTMTSKEKKQMKKLLASLE